jgi:hypothetical protein
MPYTVAVKDVPTDGFWSITVYGEDNYLKPDARGHFGRMGLPGDAAQQVDRRILR